MILEFQKTFTDFFGHQQLVWTSKMGGVSCNTRWCGWSVVSLKVSMLMWNCLEDLDSFKRLILDRFGSNFEGWRGLRVINADKDELPATYSAFCWASRAVEVPKEHDFQNVKFQGSLDRPSLHTRLLLMCLWWLYFNRKKHVPRETAEKPLSPSAGKCFDLINPEYEVESQCRKGRSGGMIFFWSEENSMSNCCFRNWKTMEGFPKISDAFKDGSLKPPWKTMKHHGKPSKFEQKSHLALYESKIMWDHGATTQLEPKNNACRSSTISTVGVQIGWFWLAFSMSNESWAIFVQKNLKCSVPLSLFHKNNRAHFAKCLPEQNPKNNSDPVGGSLDFHKLWHFNTLDVLLP